MRVPTERRNADLRPGSGTEIFWLAGILILATALRLWRLGAKSLWLDEIMTVQKATTSFAAMLAQIRQHDAHPPLFQIVEWLWLRLEKNDLYARMPSVLAGVACVWLCFLIARRLFDRKSALAAAVMAALSCYGVFYSQEARLHAFMTALFLGQFCLLLTILERRGKAGWGLWLAYGALGLASLYTYALCALAIGALGLLYLWLTRRRNRQFGRWLAVHATIALLFLPWVPTLRARTAELDASIRAHHDSIGRPSFPEVAGGIVVWTIGPRAWQPNRYLCAALGLGCLLVAARAAWRKNRRPVKILGVLFVVPLLLYLILPMPRVHVYEPKHLMFMQPLLLIALSGARWTIRKQGEKAKRIPILLIVALGFVAINALGLREYFEPGFEKENWRALAADVSNHLQANDLILFNPGYVGYAFDYYARIPADLPLIARASADPLLQPDVRIEGNPSRIWMVEDWSPVARPSRRMQTILNQKGWYPGTSRLMVGLLGNLKWTLYLPKDIAPEKGLFP